MMTFRLAALWPGVLWLAAAQSSPDAVVNNLDEAKWSHDRESDSVVLHSDAKSGALDLLVRFPAGHVIPPHFHDANERIVVVEGQLVLGRSAGDTLIKTGGYAFLPAREVQRLSCGSGSRCTFYLSWDGNPKSHPAK
jgi:quercetin dioxygenase-like cupin family protein